MERMELAAALSLAEILARTRFGIAIAAMINMIATTISNSISENPAAAHEHDLGCRHVIRNSDLLFEDIFAGEGP
jgi:hypothetical protein